MAFCIKCFLIDVVKQIACYTGWNGGKTEKDRKYLSNPKKLPTDYNDLPFRSITEEVNVFHESEDEILFIHIILL